MNMLYVAEDTAFPGPATASDYEQFRGSLRPICLDNGSFTFRAGWTGESDPRFAVDNVVSRYKDRKNQTYITLAGSQVYADGTSRLNIRYPYEGDVVCNFDAMEHMLDYTFCKLGIDDCPTIEHPIAMTEAISNPPYSRGLLNELLFENYRVPAVGFANDALASLLTAGIGDSLVISSSASGTTIMPVLDGVARLNCTKRLSWGGTLAADYFIKLLQLKYPAFATKLTLTQANNVIKDFCYLSPDYSEDVNKLQDPDEIVKIDKVLQFPFQTVLVEERSEQELEAQTQRRKEQMKKMQEMAAKQRVEKFAQKEQDMVLFQELKEGRATEDRYEWQRRLEALGFGTEAELDEAMRKTERAIKKQRNKQMGIEGEGSQEPPTFPLVDVPDHLLTEADLKDKRRQKLMKAGYEARIKARAEKEAEKIRQAEEAQADAHFRATNPEGWLALLRQQHETMLNRIKDRETVRTQLGDRKSLAAQNRMKSIATLASDVSIGRSKRKKTAEDNFGANDADWAVYREIGGDDESEEEEDEESQLRAIEARLIEFDPSFTEDDTASRMNLKKQPLLNAFTRAIRPADPLSSVDLSDPAQAAQLHVNIERIRIPEALYQPQMAGIDQAGLIEIVGHILRQFPPDQQQRMLANVYVCGGCTLVPNFDQRLSTGLKSILPAGAAYHIKRPTNAQMPHQSWRGLSKWASTTAFKSACLTQQDYLEKGGEYLKEHALVPIWS